jgi:predicted  nucleic acid-binding Zn-ribbon protein
MAKPHYLFLLLPLGLSACIERPMPQPPSPQVQALAEATTMTRKAKRAFYENNPTIEKKKNFLNLCQHTEKTIVLGCYSNQRRIYLQDIQDKRLKGVMEVTAAHEMLHDIYEHLPPWERIPLDQRLQDAFARVQNPRIIKLVNSYREQSNGDRILLHELHSILGTEVRDLGDPELEAHYAKYFDDRLTLVAFSEKYETTFNKLHAEADRLKKALSTTEAELNEISGIVKASDGEISVESEEMGRLREDLERLSQQDITSYSLANEFEQKKAQFNARVPDFNARVDAHRSKVSQLKETVSRYNTMVKDYNAIAQEENSLINVLKSEVTPIPEATSKTANPQ